MLDRMEQQKEGPMSSSLVLEHLAMQERAIEIEEEFVDDAPEQYRAVSGLAVFSLVIAVLSLPALLLPLPVSVLFMGGAILATVLGLVAARTIRQRPDELLGSSVAWTGAILGAGTLAASIAWNAYVTATEASAFMSSSRMEKRLTFPTLRGRSNSTESVSTSRDTLIRAISVTA
jgi:hypothetical protein